MGAEIVTLRLRGEGGSEWDEDLAPVGSPRREVQEALIENGTVKVLGEVVDGTVVPVEVEDPGTGVPMEAVEVPVGETGELVVGDPDLPPAPEVVRPAANGSKDDWVAYAVALGLDAGTAEAMSRNELRDAFPEGD